MNSTASSTARSDELRAAWKFCYAILPDVSRTFALTIPVLRAPLTDPVCIAYLLCRIADTIEDRNDLELDHRRSLYALFCELVEDPQRERGDDVQRFLGSWPPDASPAYQRLVEGMQQVLVAYGSLPPSQLAAIRDCVHEMVGGMAEMTHPEPRDGVVWVCRDLDQLERYCHYVAGTVGLMLTRLFDDRIDGQFSNEERLEEGRRFGLGLQLTNVLKDYAVDWERGTTFIPAPWMGTDGTIEDAALAELILRTLGHLETAQRYTMALPAEHDDMRLFCLWALWMALGTLREVARCRGRGAKISRLEVTEIIATSRARVGDDAALESRFATMREQVIRAVESLQ